MRRLAIYVALAAVLAACSAGDAQPAEADPQTDCTLPWSDLDQVFDCGAPAYELAGMEGTQIANIIVAERDPAIIASALAHAWNEHIPASEEAVVWAWSSAQQIGQGYDRGVLSEQGMLGEELVFEVCTEWEPLGDGDLCTDIMEFTISQE